jgi:hypothetical protein
MNVFMQVEVKWHLCLINWASRHKDEWGNGGIAPPFLTSAPDGGQWSTSCHGRFNPGARTSGTHYIGGWVGPRAGSKLWRREKSLDLAPVARRYTGSPFVQDWTSPISRVTSTRICKKRKHAGMVVSARLFPTITMHRSVRPHPEL